MKQMTGSSRRGDLQEALKVGKITSPALLVLMSSADKFEEHVAQLEAAFPRVPGIGCINMSYDRQVIEKGVMVVAYTEGVTAAANVTKKDGYFIGELNGRPAKQVYTEILQIDEKAIESQTFKNPFGKISGVDTSIVSVKGPVGNGLSCFRAVNDSDVLTILEAKDTFRIVGETIAQIRQDFTRVSAVFSINCLFRYLYFQQNGELQQYLDTMGTLGNHAGLFGYGEHYNDQFLNQTMTCVVFE